MRVLLANKYHYLQGGAERAYFDYDRLLREAGHQTIHFSMRDPHNEASPWSRFFVSNVRHDRAVWHPASWKAAARTLGGAGVKRALRALLAEARPDAAILHNVYHQLGQSSLIDALAAAGIPMIVVLHDYKAVCPAHSLLRAQSPCEECSGGAFLRAARHGCGGSRARGLLLSLDAFRQRPRYARVAAFAAPSRFLIDKVRAMGFPHELQLLPNPVIVPPQPADPARGSAVGYLGRLSPEKGLHTLLEAAARLPSVPVRVAGAGPLAAELERRRPDNLTLLGHLGPAALDAEMRTWRAVAVPSLWYENLPYAVLDAFALGLPVVGSDRGSLAELLSGRGVAVPPGDARALASALGGLWEDGERCRRLGAAGREFVRERCAPPVFLETLTRLLEAIRAPNPARDAAR